MPAWVVAAFRVALWVSVLISPTTTSAQAATPLVIGSLTTASLPSVAAAFRRGLREQGFVEGKNLLIVERGADGQYERLSRLAAELVSQRVDLIFAAGGNAPALAAKAATTRIYGNVLAG